MFFPPGRSWHGAPGHADTKNLTQTEGTRVAFHPRLHSFLLKVSCQSYSDTGADLVFFFQAPSNFETSWYQAFLLSFIALHHSQFMSQPGWITPKFQFFSFFDRPRDTRCSFFFLRESRVRSEVLWFECSRQSVSLSLDTVPFTSPFSPRGLSSLPTCQFYILPWMLSYAPAVARLEFDEALPQYLLLPSPFPPLEGYFSTAGLFHLASVMSV